MLGAMSVVSRKGLEHESFDIMVLVSLGVAAPVFLVLAWLTGGFADAPLIGLAWIVLGALLGSVVGRSLYFIGVNYLGPGKSLSISATSPIYAAVLSALVLGEDVTVLVGLGTLAIVFGIVGISRDVRRETSRSGRSILVFLAPAIGAIFAGATVVARKLALDLGVPPIDAAALNMTAALAFVAPAVALRRGSDLLRVDRRAIGYFFVASVILAVGFVLYFIGLRSTPAVVFFPLTQTQPLFAVILSALVLGDLEVITYRTVLGAVLIVGGAALVVIG